MISQDEIWDDYFAASDALRERYAAERKDLQILDLRGNVPTRIKKLRDGKYFKK